MSGRGGEIDGVANPQLPATPGQTVQINLVNEDGAEHDITVPGAGAASEPVEGTGSETSMRFEVHQDGRFAYYSSTAGDRDAGMQGWLVVGRGGEAAAALPAVASGDQSQGSAALPARLSNRIQEMVHGK